MMKHHPAFRFLAGGSLLVLLMFQGLPIVLAFAQRPTARYPKTRQVTTVLNQSSRSLFSRSQTFPKDEKQFQDVREARKNQEQQQRAVAMAKQDSKGHWWDKNILSIPMENNIQLLRHPPVSLLDRGTAVTATAAGFLTLLALCGLLKTGRLTTIFRHTLWWMEYMFTSYKSLLLNNPLSTKVGTGAVLAVLGDALAQSLTNGGKTYDKRRAASFAAFDACYRVFQHHMFPAVIALCQGNVLASLGIMPSIGAAMERTMVYQLLVVPLIYYPVFFAFTGFIQGLNFQQTIERFKTSYFRCWRRNLTFWIPTQMVLFGAINEHFQIPFACVMGVLWSMILSLTAGKTK
ncbi:Mpv17 / PMP22 family protein [Nitzschia inconspicua]|uniref:Mpv17 / PMP22 family protein n=1 Tax=Nitzschia inconspicua TaxID=303405 RepID=A0A9K3LRD9_9STRA|nr:Mpv17 / PMP22 family protein [Nitzschia inconspicua]